MIRSLGTNFVLFFSVACYCDPSLNPFCFLLLSKDNHFFYKPMTFAFKKMKMIENLATFQILSNSSAGLNCSKQILFRKSLVSFDLQTSYLLGTSKHLCPAEVNLVWNFRDYVLKNLLNLLEFRNCDPSKFWAKSRARLLLEFQITILKL